MIATPAMLKLMYSIEINVLIASLSCPTNNNEKDAQDIEQVQCYDHLKYNYVT